MDMISWNDFGSKIDVYLDSNNTVFPCSLLGKSEKSHTVFEI